MAPTRRYAPKEDGPPPTYGEFLDCVAGLLAVAGAIASKRTDDEPIDPETDELAFELVSLVRRAPSLLVGGSMPGRAKRRVYAGDLLASDLHLSLRLWFQQIWRVPEQAHGLELESLASILERFDMRSRAEEAAEVLDGDAGFETFWELVDAKKSPSACATMVVARLTPTKGKTLELLTPEMTAVLQSIRETERANDGLADSEECLRRAGEKLKLPDMDEAALRETLARAARSHQTLAITGAAHVLGLERLHSLAHLSLLDDLGLEPTHEDVLAAAGLPPDWFEQVLGPIPSDEE